jgi:hypothetical protein
MPTPDATRDDPARQILIRGALALRGGPGVSTLATLVELAVEQLAVESAVIVAAGRGFGEPAIAAGAGLGEAAAAGLTVALRNPDHPIRRTLADGLVTFDVAPMNPGGPALRSHLPLVIARDGQDAILGVLALAHHVAIPLDRRPLVEAIADLAAAGLALEGRLPS